MDAELLLRLLVLLADRLDLLVGRGPVDFRFLKLLPIEDGRVLVHIVSDYWVRSVILLRVAKDLNTFGVGDEHALFVKLEGFAVTFAPSLAEGDPIQLQSGSRLEKRRDWTAHDHADLLLRYNHWCVRKLTHDALAVFEHLGVALTMLRALRVRKLALKCARGILLRRCLTASSATIPLSGHATLFGSGSKEQTSTVRLGSQALAALPTIGPC